MTTELHIALYRLRVFAPPTAASPTQRVIAAIAGVPTATER